jgi:hypothetical protein
MNNPIVRMVAGIVAGALVAMAVIVGFESLNLLLHPLPPGIDLSDPAAMKAFAAAAPAGALLVVLAGYVAGTFAGVFVAAKVSRSAIAGAVVALLLVAGGIVNMLTIPHPVWFWAASLVAYVVMAWAAIVAARTRGVPLPAA